MALIKKTKNNNKKDVAKEFFSALRGDDGYTPVKGKDYTDGYTPVKGKDYTDGYTPTDQELINLIIPLIPEVKDGHTPTVKELVAIIRPLIPEVKDGETPSDERLIKLIQKCIPEYKTITFDEIIDEINSKKEILEFKTIKGLSDEINNRIPKQMIGAPRIKVLNNGQEMSAPLGSLNFLNGTITNNGQDYAYTSESGGGSQNLQQVTDIGATTTVQSTFSGGLLTGLGSASNPSYSFDGNLNTGMWSPTTDTLAWSNGGVETMRLTSGGQLLIGSTTAIGTSKIEVTGTGSQGILINSSGANTSSLGLGNSTNGTILLQISGTNFNAQHTTGAQFIHAVRGGALLLNTNSTTGALQGNIGIGVTSANATARLTLQTATPTTAQDLMVLKDSTAINQFKFSLNSANTPGLFIGTQYSSGTGLFVDTGFQSCAVFSRGTSVSISMDFGSALPKSIYTLSSKQYSVGLSGTTFRITDGVTLGTNDRFVIDTNGNVGIGTSAPSARLNIISTTEQFRSGVTASIYWNAVTTDTTGVTTINAVGGTTPSFVFSKGISLPYVAKTATYTVTLSDYTVDCTTGTFTVNLITAVGNTGKIYIIKNTGAGTITIDADASETIDGALTVTLSTNQSATLQSTGVGWIII